MSDRENLLPTGRSMDILPLLTSFLSLLLTLLFLLSLWRRQKKYHNLPPGPTPLPLLGNINYLTMAAACKYYPELSKKYGPVFTVWQLSDPIVVLCGYEAVKDALVNHADQFSGRPFLAVNDAMTKGFTLGTYSNHWIQFRRFLLMSLRNFGMGKKAMEERILTEAEHLIQAISEMEGKAFNSLHLLSCAINSVISSVLFGQRLDYQDKKLLDLIIHIRIHIGNTHSPLHQLCNMFPVLLHLPFLKQKVFGPSSYIKATIQEQIDRHKQKLDPSSPKDVMDYFLQKIKEEEKVVGSNFCDTSLLMFTMGLLSAGTDTTSRSLQFCIMVISHFPDIQAKVQQEIDDITGSLRPPGIMDRAHMPYTNAVIHESQRHFDLAPIGHYHAITKDTEFRGFIIPKGTTVIPFLSSVLFDPTQWETPEQFNPGHFLDDKGQFRVRPAFMVFSAGKRVCLGENLARTELFLFFCSLLQKFTFRPANGSQQQDIQFLTKNKMALIGSCQLYAVPRSSTCTVK
ncbi:cytochrome P450 2A10-like [Rhinophrynus dorsalis]